MKDKIKTYTSLPSERLVQNPAFRQAFTHTGAASELIILAIVKYLYCMNFIILDQEHDWGSFPSGG